MSVSNIYLAYLLDANKKVLTHRNYFSIIFSCSLGQLDRIPKYRQLHEQIAAFLRNPLPEYLPTARRLKEYMDRIISSMANPPANDQSTSVSSGATSNTRTMSNEIFDQCQRTIVEYLSKDSTLKYNISKRFLEPLSEMLNGVPHKYMRFF